MNILKSELQNLKKKYSKKTLSYTIPSIWFNTNDLANSANLNSETTLNPFDFFLENISNIESLPPLNSNNRTYNLFIRFNLAWNHNFITEHKKFERDAFNNNGTILKAIAILPYIHSLGCSTVHLLPITEIGKSNRKGNLGSPYAIKNHNKIDPNLSEKILETDLETQYKAFVEAAHKLGIKVIQEFIFRTASIDADMALENPDWFYWIKSNVKLKDNSDSSGYGPPSFSDRKLAKIKEMFEAGNFSNTIHPDDKYKNYFTKSPLKTARVDDHITGLLTAIKPSKSNEVKLAPAFADWPPDDNQPPWTDVTYLKLYDNIKFNYVAYNTVRAYDEDLSKDINKVNSLWDYIKNILPHWIKTFDIDGAMIDMGHALPKELLSDIISEALSLKKEFIFWEENFVPNEKSKEIGYDAVMGYLMFDSHNQKKYKDLIHKVIENQCPIEFFLTPENHNTKRAFSRFESRNFSIACYLINSLLGNINFIHSGFELLEETPVNSGLSFTNDELAEIESKELPLFSENQLKWTSDNIIKEILEINKFTNELGKIESLELIDNNELIILEINQKFKLIVNLEDNLKYLPTQNINPIFKFGEISIKETIKLDGMSGLVYC